MPSFPNSLSFSLDRLASGWSVLKSRGSPRRLAGGSRRDQPWGCGWKVGRGQDRARRGRAAEEAAIFQEPTIALHPAVEIQAMPATRGRIHRKASRRTSMPSTLRITDPNIVMPGAAMLMTCGWVEVLQKLVEAAQVGVGLERTPNRKQNSPFRLAVDLDPQVASCRKNQRYSGFGLQKMPTILRQR